ncbi:hypothetical protein H9W90_04465 [Polaribacter pectinis]|uniref:Uncharacterized protein n=1 Tax=Polaribacter pectinis TaxID=2738844 RepID=A0A7G9LCN4_9FLAO|nr:hypothetical protein [Polaribacter pectinis]QNM86383.1 hypothetical protein H9W90_04465 [Polaribacter pectinis]
MEKEITSLALAFELLKIIDNNNWLDIKFKLKNNKNVVRLYLKDNSLEPIFGAKVKQPFSVYLGKSSITLYFRANQEYITKGIETLRLDFNKPNQQEEFGDYYVRITDIKDIEKLIDFIFIKKLKLNYRNIF